MIQSLAGIHTLKVRLKLARALAARPWFLFFTMFQQIWLCNSLGLAGLHAQIFHMSGWPKRWVTSWKNSGKAMSNCRQDDVEVLIGMAQDCTCLASPSLPHHQLHRHIDSIELPGSYCPTEQNVYLSLVSTTASLTSAMMLLLWASFGLRNANLLYNDY